MEKFDELLKELTDLKELILYDIKHKNKISEIHMNNLNRVTMKHIVINPKINKLIIQASSVLEDALNPSYPFNFPTEIRVQNAFENYIRVFKQSKPIFD